MRKGRGRWGGSAHGEAGRYSLDIFGPGWRVVLGHEHAVGEDGAHDEHAEERGRVKENEHGAGRTLTCPAPPCPSP